MELLKKVVTWVKALFGKSKDWLAIGVKIANQIKQYSDSPLLDIITKLTPTDIDDKLLSQWRTIMSKLITELGYADTVINTLSDDAKTIVLSNLSSLSAKVSSDLNDKSLNLQQAIVGTPVVYDEKAVLA